MDSPTANEINIDCYGKHFPNETEKTVLLDGTKVNFLFNQEEKKGRSFILGLYINRAVTESGRTTHVYEQSDHLLYPYEHRVCLLTEHPFQKYYNEIEQISYRFKYIFTAKKNLIQKSSKYIPFYYGTSFLRPNSIEAEYTQKNKLISFVGSVRHGNEHGYQLRKKVVSKLLNHSKVDCYGYGINPIKDKREGLDEYYFSIAMENICEDYYFTEKLIDCYMANTVPIYWGCSGINKFLDPKGLIQFRTLDELLDIIPSLTIEKYYEMLPFVKKNKNIIIKNNWHSLEGLYKRLARELINRYGRNNTHQRKPKVFILADELKRIYGTERKKEVAWQKIAKTVVYYFKKCSIIKVFRKIKSVRNNFCK